MKGFSDIIKFSLKNIEELVATQQKEINRLQDENEKLKAMIGQMRDRDSDFNFKRFCKERVVHHDGSATPLPQLFRAYNRWSEWNGSRHKIGRLEFEKLCNETYEANEQAVFKDIIVFLDEEEKEAWESEMLEE